MKNAQNKNESDIVFTFVLFRALLCFILFTNNIFCLLIPAMMKCRARDFWTAKSTTTIIRASTAPNARTAAVAIVMTRLAE